MELSTVRKLEKIFEKLCEQRTCLIFANHHHHENEINAENVYVIEDGNLTELKSS